MFLYANASQNVLLLNRLYYFSFEFCIATLPTERNPARFFVKELNKKKLPNLYIQMQADALVNVHTHTGNHRGYGCASNIIMKLRTRQKILRSIQSLQLRVNNNFYQKKKKKKGANSVWQHRAEP